MTQSKPQIIVDLDAQSDSPLKAETYLSRLKPTASFHEALDCRHPLGIYNVSTVRILKKLTKCCNRLEEYLRAAPSVSQLLGNESKKDETIDYIELCLYAAAEHVDDLDSLARCFFKDNNSAGRSPHTRKLKSNTKPIRDRISAFTNAIKHSQSRIRICSQDFEQAAGSVCLHGFFIEKFHNAAVSPSPIFHSRERVISITSFLWSVLTYLFSMSDALCEFLIAMDVVESADGPVRQTPLLRDCVIALARLPLYSSDDVHPFEKTTFIVKGGEGSRREIDSNIYGSLMRRWSKSKIASVGKASMGYEGDGTTKSFQINLPTNLRTQHWD
ncbi:MAG: hypothetical protein ACHQRJ_02720 [Alphaproteobacteria bacterium]